MTAPVDLPPAGAAVVVTDAAGGSRPTTWWSTAGDVLAVVAPDGAPTPSPGAPLHLEWPLPRGVAQLPVEVVRTERAAADVWWVAPVAEVEHQQRRDFVRVAPVPGRLELVGVGAEVTGRIADLSEGGVRGVVDGDLQTATGQPVQVHLTLVDEDGSSEEFVVPGALLRSRPVADRTEVVVEFDQPVPQADRLRRAVFAAQRRARSL